MNGRDPGCTMRTVKEMTGIGINHFMMVDFNAVKTLSAAVGGVEVCLTKPIRDMNYSKLDLSAGEHRIQGEQALAFLRNRHGLGNQSDLDRIKMQQQFLASMMRQLKEDTLDSPTQLLSVANAATEALTVDKGIGSALKLTSLAKEIGKVDLKNISFMTVPVIDNPDEPPARRATVVLDPVKAPQVFGMIQNDVSFTEVKKKQQDAKNAQAQAQAKLLQGPGPRPPTCASTSTTAAASRGRPGDPALAPERAGRAPLDQQEQRPREGGEDHAHLRTEPGRSGPQARGPDGPARHGSPAGHAGRRGARAHDARPRRRLQGRGVPVTGPAKAPDVEKVEADKQVCAK